MSTTTAEKTWFGHPRGLTFLFGTEMWERFSYYGMRALLVLYLVKYLLLPGHVEHVLFYPQVKAFFEMMAGPLAPQPLSSLIYGTYTGLIYATPLLGGWMADNYLGQRKAAMVGIIMMAFGHFLMASEAMLFPALTLLIFGGGFFKTNTTAQVGMLYGPGDERRDRAYSIFYVGVNLGAFIAPLVAGTLGETVGWHYGFGAAGVGMLIALAVYVLGWKHLPAEGLREKKATKKDRTPLSSEEWKSVLALVLLVVPLTLWWACYEQQGNIIALFADAATDRRLIPGVINWEIPVTWFQAFNPFIIFAFTPFVLALWTRQARDLKEPNSMYKIAYGCAMLAASYVLIAFASWYGAGHKISWLWLLAYFVIITTGEIFLSPISMSLYSKVAPVRIVSIMMAVNFIPNFLGGGFIQGWLGTYWESMGHPAFFLMIAAIGLVSGVMIWLMEKPLEPYLNKSHD
ncbi:MAG: peptide MFS transporter [Alphaproteobacteria bacterium]|nr:peptide MFS transporter [Alphaproteobacteria bacterium]